MNKMETFKNLTEGTFVKLTGMSVKNENDIFVVDCDYRIAGKYGVCHDERCLNKVKLNGEKKTGGYDIVFLNEHVIEKNSNIEIEIVTDLKRAKKEVNNYLNGVASEEIVVTYKISGNQNIEKGSIIRFKKGISLGTFGTKYIGKNSIFVVAGCEKTLWIQRLGKQGQVLSLLDSKNSYNFSENLYKKVIDEEYIEVVEKIETKKGDMTKSMKADKKQTKVSTQETTTTNLNTTNTVLDHVTIISDINTKTKENIHVVKLNNKIDYEVFKAFEVEIKAIGGYYSRFKKGFIFSADPTEKLLTIDVNILTGANEINKSETIEERTNELHTEDTIEINPIEDAEILNSVIIEGTEEDTITTITTEDGNVIKLNMNVTGYWGAMYPYSHGTITKIANNLVTIKWNEEEELGDSIEDINVLKFGEINKIGIYVKNEVKTAHTTNIVESTINTTVIEQPEQTPSINPISIEHVEDQNIRIKGIFAALNKNNTIEEYKEEVERDCYISNCKITDIATLSSADYEIFTHNLLTDYDFIAGKGGTNSDYETDKTEFFQLTKDELTEYRKQCYNLCVMIKAEGKESILIDPQGYNYSRYVAFMDEQPQQDKTPIEPAQNTKEEIKVININKNTNSINSNNNNNNNSTETTDIKELSEYEENIKRLFKDALNEIIEEQSPNIGFNHEIKYKQAKIIDFTSYKHKKA